MSTFCTRMVWPNSAVGGTQTTVNGRTYIQVPGGVFDAMNQDVSGLVTAGAITIAQSGAIPLSLAGTLLGITGTPATGGTPGLPTPSFSGIQGQIQASNIAAVPDVAHTSVGGVPGTLFGKDPFRPIPVTLPTNATSTNLVAVLHFGTGAAALAALSGVVPGMTVRDNTTPASEGAQTVVSVNSATGDVTLSANNTGAIGATDSITFSPALGTLYMDVALNRMIVWDGNYWRDTWNGQIV